MSLTNHLLGFRMHPSPPILAVQGSKCGQKVWSLLLKVILFRRATRFCNSDTRKTEAGEPQVRASRARPDLKTPKQTEMVAEAKPTCSRTLGVPLPGMPRACERRGQVRVRPHVTPGRARRESESLRLLARLAFLGRAEQNLPAPSRETAARGTGSALATGAPARRWRSELSGPLAASLPGLPSFRLEVKLASGTEIRNVVQTCPGSKR